MEEEKGCVYFFKHIGLTPVKIGFSNNESPINRFEQFKTYAPYGAELLGFIRTDKAKELETLLHQKFSFKRMKGEWFELTNEDVSNTIKFYSNIADIEEKNKFEIEWANKINKSKKVSILFNKFSVVKNEKYNKEIVLNQAEISEIIKIDKIEVKNKLKENFIFPKTHRFEGKIKKGYKFFIELLP